jgi:hypothetical protein
MLVHINNNWKKQCMFYYIFKFTENFWDIEKIMDGLLVYHSLLFKST